jgi:hypothetical protein
MTVRRHNKRMKLSAVCNSPLIFLGFFNLPKSNIPAPFVPT